MTCTNLILNHIIDYCSTWYGINHGEFKAMFVALTYLQVDDDFSKKMKLTMRAWLKRMK
jgi:hypothetical protein